MPAEIPSDHWLLNPSISANEIAELHRRWAVLIDERGSLLIAKGDANCKGPPEYVREVLEKFGSIEAVDIRVAAITEEIEGLEDEIFDQPIAPYGLAVLLDVGLEHGSGLPGPYDDLFWSEWAALIAYRAAAALAPGFKFTFFGRYHSALPLDAAGIPIEDTDAEDDPAAPAAERLAALRARAEALAADARAPLPPGDAGLIEAERRQVDFTRRSSELYREFEITKEEEDEIIAPLFDAANNGLCDYIIKTAPEGLAAVAAKLRFLERSPNEEMDIADCLAVIEQAQSDSGAP